MRLEYKKQEMKKILLSILVIAFGLGVNAQGIFSLGPKVGYNSYKLSGNADTVQASIKNSFQIGAFMRIGSKVYFQPEANYQVSESTLTQNIGTIVKSQVVTLKSLKVPALIGFKIINKSAFNLRLMAGPAITFILDKQLNPSQMGELWPIQSIDDLKDKAWSVQMGAGLDVLFMTLDVRYEFGVDNIYNGGSAFEMKNNMFNHSLGIKLL
jgi:hypothetical protein